MKRNEKIVLGMVVAAVAAQELRFHTFKKRVRGFVNATNDYLQAQYQAQIDEVFEQIVEDYDR